MVVARVADAAGPYSLRAAPFRARRQICKWRRADRHQYRRRPDALTGGELHLESRPQASYAVDPLLFEGRHLSLLKPSAVLDEVGDRDRSFATVLVVGIDAGFCAPGAYSRLRVRRPDA